MSGHTPTPWTATRSDPAEGYDVWWLTGGEGNFETEIGSVAGGKLLGRSKANAELIVRAVNSHSELIEALEFYANPEIYKPHPHGPAFDRRDLSFRARAALAKAKGETT